MLKPKGEEAVAMYFRAICVVMIVGFCLLLALSGCNDGPEPENRPPRAEAGPDQTVMVGATVQLDGRGSSDVDGDPLSFLWALTSLPAGSAAGLSAPTAAQPTFVVDRPGTYIAQLIVNDGMVASAPDTVTVIATAPPAIEVLGIFSETAAETLEFDVNAFIGTFTGGGATFAEFVEDAGDKQEGTISLRATVSVNAAQGGFAGWFVSWGNAAQVANDAFVRDMSQFAGGRLLFWVRSPVDLEVGIRSGNVAAGSETSKVLVSRFEPAVADNTWHRVCIPLAGLAGPPPKADLSRMKVFFVVASNTPSRGTGGMPATFRIDDVRWEKVPCR